MSLRVAFDMDGTVADMYSVLRREAERLFGTAGQPAAAPLGTDPAPPPAPAAAQGPASPPVVEALHLTPRQQRQLWERVASIENFWDSLPEEEPGIIARIAETARTRRWEVLFITTRPPSAGDTTQLQTQRWLHAHGFALPSVFVVQRSRGKLADALQLDAVVDDRPENCMDVALDSKAKPVLVWHGPLETVPAGVRKMGVKPVSSISEALALLERMDDARKQSSLVRSIRRMLRRDPSD
jgi:phosphoglycolate phosphatase-like HAD superfamily hydrolase